MNENSVKIRSTDSCLDYGLINGCGYPAEPFRRIICYPEEPFRRIICYPEELFRRIICYPEEPFRRIICYPEEPFHRIICYPEESFSSHGKILSQQNINLKIIIMLQTTKIAHRKAGVGSLLWTTEGFQQVNTKYS